MNAPPTVTSTNVPPVAVNNNAINGLQTLGLNGPGVIQASGNMVIGFNKLGIHWDLDPTFFLNEENLIDGILKAVEYTLDSDTIGAIFGAMFGAYYGSYPEDLVRRLEVKEEIDRLLDKLLQSVK